MYLPLAGQRTCLASGLSKVNLNHSELQGHTADLQIWKVKTQYDER